MEDNTANYTQPAGTNNESGKRKARKVNPITLLLTVIIVLLIAALGFLYYQYRQNTVELSKLRDPQYLSQLQTESAQAAVEKVKKLMLLPEETPTIATITDADALRTENAEFYKDAQNGDMLLIYQKKAILYRESQNLIINVAPVFIDPNSTTENTEGTTEDSTTEDSTTDDGTETPTE